MSMHPTIEKKVVDDITRCGLSIIGVMSNPSFSYTIGLVGLLGYELIILGLRPEYAGMIFNDIHEFLKAGAKIELDKPDTRFANMPVMFKMATTPRTHSEYVIQADAYYGTEIQIAQVVMCDASGKFPHELGYNHEYMNPRQELLYETIH